MPSIGDTRRWILICFLLEIARRSSLLGYLAFRGSQKDREPSAFEEHLWIEEKR